MALALILASIVILYFRTWDYYQVIDDYNPREMYPLPPKESKDPKFYATKTGWKFRLLMVGMHMVNTSIIYTLWGWGPALLFAVHPMSAWGTAWKTGHWYNTTLYFLLTAYFFIHSFPGWGVIPGCIFFITAMYSTFDAITFPFVGVALLQPWGFMLLPAMVAFLKGKKFKSGLESRTEINNGKNISRQDFPFNRLALMVKVTAKYTYEAIVPMHVKFFTKWGENIRDYDDVYEDMHKFNREFWVSLALCVAVFIAGLIIFPLGILWWFCLIGLHCQFNIVGQTYAQRYIIIALPGLCAVVGAALINYPTITLMIASALALRTHQIIPIWSNIESVFLHEIEENQERGDSYGALAQIYLTILPLEEYQPFMINMIAYLLRKAVVLNPRSWTMRMNLSAYLCKTGQVEEGLEQTAKTIELMEKYCSEREKPILQEMYDQQQRWQNIGKDVERMKELEYRKKRQERNNNKGGKGANNKKEESSKVDPKEAAGANATGTRNTNPQQG